MLTLTVNQLNRYVKAVLEEDKKIQDIYLKAEISNFKNHYSSGHLYFTLKDKSASVNGVMFRSYAQQLQFEPKEGMALLVRGYVGLYEIDGSYQFYVTEMQPDGIGAAEVALQQLKEKLEKKGYFLEKNKKPLPKYPETIGIITSKNGAALGDITKVLTTRYPIAKIKFCDAMVQGNSAAPSLIRALHTLDRNCDVIILGRGGGSKEDLFAFNDESLAEAIYYAKTPIISAVGHEIDVTICDLVADQRAATPSAAAEIATPSVHQINTQISYYTDYIYNHSMQLMNTVEKKVKQLNDTEILKTPVYFIEKQEKWLDFIRQTMYTIKDNYFSKEELNIRNKILLVDSLSPLTILGRGYALVKKDDEFISSTTKLSDREEIVLYLKDGSVNVEVKSISKERIL